MCLDRINRMDKMDRMVRSGGFILFILSEPWRNVVGVVFGQHEHDEQDAAGKDKGRDRETVDGAGVA